jgi:hypothetical protein
MIMSAPPANWAGVTTFERKAGGERENRHQGEEQR